MSRREEEFKHRTSVFEGAYRAWSHLGGLEPDEIELRSAKDLDPITYVLLNDTRAIVNRTRNVNDDGSARRDCPHEPLPRSGLAHPFVQAVLAPWLGPNADNDAVKAGLDMLRNWWQKRRNGENKSSVKTLGTAKMRVVVDKYTRHFFDLAHCLVVSDDAQPPRTLQIKLKQLSKERRGQQGLSMEDDDDDDDFSASQPNQAGATNLQDSAHGQDDTAQTAQMHRFEGLSLSSSTPDLNTAPLVNVRGKCIPGKIDLPGMVDAVSRHAEQLTHRGGMASIPQSGEVATDPFMYGNPSTAPIVFQTLNGSHYFIVMSVDGITCAHCVKIVETVLKGCTGGKSPIAGLLDAAADRGVSCVAIQIDAPKNAKRIAFESARNLALVGYTALVKEIAVDTVASASNDKSEVQAARLDSIQQAMMDLNKAYPFELFDFTPQCACPDGGVFRENCPRHSQMSDRMFKALASHERLLAEFVQSQTDRCHEANPQHQPQQMYQGIMPHRSNVRHDHRLGDGYHPDGTKPLQVRQTIQIVDLDSLPLDEKATDVDSNAMEELQLSASSFSSAMFQPNALTEAVGHHSGACDEVGYYHHPYGPTSNDAVPAFTYSSSTGDTTADINNGAGGDGTRVAQTRGSFSALSVDWETFELLEHSVDNLEEVTSDVHP